MSLTGKVGLVVGASRGIGRCVAVGLARQDMDVCVASKTISSSQSGETVLPGNLEEVGQEISALGKNSLCVQCDVRDDEAVKNTIQQCVEQLGGLNLVVYNAAAIWWNTIANTSLKRFDLLHQVNVRGCFSVVKEALPKLMERKDGHIIIISPPVYSKFLQGKVAYGVSKFGMTLFALGLAEELRGTGIAVNCIWPAKVTESFVTTKLGVPWSLMRKADLFSDACIELCSEDPNSFTGQTLIDEDYMRGKGVTDFSRYRCDAEIEPPRMLPTKFPSLLLDKEEEEKPPLFPSLTPRL